MSGLLVDAHAVPSSERCPPRAESKRRPPLSGIAASGRCSPPAGCRRMVRTTPSNCRWYDLSPRLPSLCSSPTLPTSSLTQLWGLCVPASPVTSRPPCRLKTAISSPSISCQTTARAPSRVPIHGAIRRHSRLALGASTDKKRPSALWRMWRSRRRAPVVRPGVVAILHVRLARAAHPPPSPGRTAWRSSSTRTGRRSSARRR